MTGVSNSDITMLRQRIRVLNDLIKARTQRDLVQDKQISSLTPGGVDSSFLTITDNSVTVNLDSLKSVYFVSSTSNYNVNLISQTDVLNSSPSTECTFKIVNLVYNDSVIVDSPPARICYTVTYQVGTATPVTLPNVYTDATTSGVVKSTTQVFSILTVPGQGLLTFINNVKY